MIEWTEFEAASGVVLRVSAGPGGLRSIEINPRRAPTGNRNDANRLLVDAVAQLRDYFSGRRKSFELPLDPQGTEFQQKVWKALMDIPYGETRNYREIATAVGSPRAMRAVGAANGRNPLPIIVPCHRVIGADGKLVGYAGGLTVKKLLLELEVKQAKEAREAVAG
jgi:methylated-DNA-[protein]-cysteine S-methyltransferase